MKHAHKNQHEAHFKMRPVCAVCHRMFSPGARKAGFPVCTNCRKDNSWKSKLKTSRYLPSLSLPSV